MKKSSNTYAIIIWVVFILLLSPFVMNRAEAQTTFRVYARSENNTQMYFYTYDHGEANGAWGEANKITNTEVINVETW